MIKIHVCIVLVLENVLFLEDVSEDYDSSNLQNVTISN